MTFESHRSLALSNSSLSFPPAPSLCLSPPQRPLSPQKPRFQVSRSFCRAAGVSAQLLCQNAHAGLHPLRRRTKMCQDFVKETAGRTAGWSDWDMSLTRGRKLGSMAETHESYRKLSKARWGALELTLPEGRLCLPGEDLSYYPRSA